MKQKKDPIVTMAYFNRFLFPVLAVCLPLILSKALNWNLLICLGTGCSVFGAYQLIGYRAGFRHIYCSIQLTKHQTPTPHHIDWSKVSRKDAALFPIAFLLLGTAALVFGLTGS